MYTITAARKYYLHNEMEHFSSYKLKRLTKREFYLFPDNTPYEDLSPKGKA